jgi:hypothetical protein
VGGEVRLDGHEGTHLLGPAAPHWPAPLAAPWVPFVLFSRGQASCPSLSKSSQGEFCAPHLSACRQSHQARLIVISQLISSGCEMGLDPGSAMVTQWQISLIYSSFHSCGNHGLAPMEYQVLSNLTRPRRLIFLTPLGPGPWPGLFPAQR